MPKSAWAFGDRTKNQHYFVTKTEKRRKKNKVAKKSRKKNRS